MASSSTSSEDKLVDSALELLTLRYLVHQSDFGELDRQLLAKEEIPDEQQQSLCGLLYSLHDQVQTFGNEFKFLLSFLKYIRIRNLLGPFFIKMDAAEREIFMDISRAKTIEFDDGWTWARACAWNVTAICCNFGKWIQLSIADFEKKRNQETLLKLMGVVSELRRKIENLKQEIREAYHGFLLRNFSSFQVEYSPVRNYSSLDEFLESTHRNFKYLNSFQPCSNSPLREQIKEIKGELWNLICFFGHSLMSCSMLCYQDPKFKDFMSYFRGLAIRAAHVSCFCWVIVPDAEEDITTCSTMLLDLKHRIDPSTSEFLDFSVGILKLMRRYSPDQKFYSLLKVFAAYLDYGRKRVEIQEPLINVIAFVTDEQGPEEESSGDAQSFVEDIKAVIRDVRSLDYSLCGDCRSMYEKCRSENYSLCGRCGTNIVFFNLFARIWLMETQIFLMKQLNSDSKSIDFEHLNLGLRFLRAFFADSPEKKTENGKNILMFIQAMAGEIASLCDSNHALTITRNRTIPFLKLLCKTQLSKAEFLLVELLNGNANTISMVPIVHDQLKNLHEGLKFLMALVTFHSDDEAIGDGKLILAQIKAAARGVMSLCYTFSSYKLSNKEMIEETYLLISGALEKFSYQGRAQKSLSSSS